MCTYLFRALLCPGTLIGCSTDPGILIGTIVILNKTEAIDRWMRGKHSNEAMTLMVCLQISEYIFLRTQ